MLEHFTQGDIAIQNQAKRIAGYLMLIVVALSLVGLAGWQFDIVMIKRPLDHLTAMNPLSALCFLFAGASWFLLNKKESDTVALFVGRFFAGLIVLVGVLRLGEIIFRWDLHLDTLIYASEFRIEADAGLARHIALNTAVNFILLGVAIIITHSREHTGGRVATILSIVVLFLALFAILGHLYGVKEYFGILSDLPVAATTAVGFLLASIALIFANCDKGMLQVVFRANAGGTTARILIPTAVIAPAIVGYGRMAIQEIFPLSLALGASYVITSITIILLVIVMFTSLIIQKKDIERSEAESRLIDINNALEQKANERAKELSRNERLFRALIQNSADAILLADRNLKVSFQSPGAERMTGISLQQRQESPGTKYTHPDDLPMIQAAIDTALGMPGIPIPFQSRFLHKLGHYIWIEGVITNLLEDEDVSALAFNYRNVTERKVLEERQRLFVSMVDSSDDAIVSMDLDGNIVTWNHGAEKLFGYRADEAIGTAASFIVPGHLKGDEVAILEKIRRGESTENHETERMAKDGKIIFVSLTVSPIYDSRRNIIGASKIVHDISERREAEQKIATSEIKFRSLIENSSDGIAMLDARTNVIYRSPATYRITRMDANQVITGPLLQPHPDDAPFLTAKFGEVYSTPGKPFSFQCRFMHDNDDGFFWIEGTITNLLHVHGVEAIVLNFHDISERKEAENAVLQLNSALEEKVLERTNQLETVNKELEAFTYSVSHDLRAPLRIINGFSQILEEDHGPTLDEKGKKTLGTIVRNAARMGQLIDDLLEFSRVSRKELRISTIDMEAQVKEIIDDLQAGGAAIHGNIVVQSIPKAKGDPNLIKQVWVNLISNAIKYSKKKEVQQIEIGAETSGDKIMYYVKDNGAGFDMAYYGKLFGVFQRLHRQDEFEGTGVGLALSQRIIMRHGGTMHAVAEVENGATFYFTLPQKT